MSEEYFLADVPDLRPKRSGAGYQRFSGIEILNRMREQKRKEAKMQEETKQEEVVETQPLVKNCVQCGREVIGKFKGRGMCQSCYNTWYNKEHKEELKARERRKRVVKTMDPAKVKESTMKAPGPQIVINLSKFMAPEVSVRLLEKLRIAAVNNFRETVEAQALAMIVEGLGE